MKSHTSGNSQASVSVEELLKHRGQWVAFSADGSRILASAADLENLEKQLAAAGHDPERVLFDRIEDEDVVLGGAEVV